MVKHKNQTYWIVGIIVVIGVLYFTGGLGNLFSSYETYPYDTMLNQGECNSYKGFYTNMKYPDSSFLEYLTFASDGTGYGVWIRINTGNDFENFASSGRFKQGGKSKYCEGVALVSDLNPYGDEIYYVNSTLYICNSEGTEAVKLSKDKYQTRFAINDTSLCNTYNPEINYECTTGSKCEGTIYSVCTNYKWVSQGQIDGQCGYNPQGNINECSGDNTKCESTTYYTCSSGNWISQGQVDGQCGYSIENNQTGNNDSSGEVTSSKIIIFGYEISIGLLVAIIVGIILLILLLT